MALEYIINKAENLGGTPYTGTPCTSEAEYWNVYWSTGNYAGTLGTSSVTTNPCCYIRKPQLASKCRTIENVESGYTSVESKNAAYAYLYTSYTTTANGPNPPTYSPSGMPEGGAGIPRAYLGSTYRSEQVGSKYGIIYWQGTYSGSAYVTSITFRSSYRTADLAIINLSNGRTYYSSASSSGDMPTLPDTAPNKINVITGVTYDKYLKVEGSSYYVKMKDSTAYESPFLYTKSGSTFTKVHQLVASCCTPYVDNSITYSRKRATLPVSEVRIDNKAVFPYLFNTNAAESRYSSHQLMIHPQYNQWHSIVPLNNCRSWSAYNGIKIDCDFYTGVWKNKFKRQLFGACVSPSTTPNSTTKLQRISAYLNSSGDIYTYVNDKLVHPGYPFKENQGKICRLTIDVNPTKVPTSSLYIYSDYSKGTGSYYSVWKDRTYGSSILSSIDTMGGMVLFGESKYGTSVSDNWILPGYQHTEVSESEATGILRFSISYYNSSGVITKTLNHYSATMANSLASRCGFLNDTYCEVDVALGNISLTDGSPGTWYLDYYAIP